MTSNTDNIINSPQNSRHCVLIDGDFGRHELFSSIHSYSLYRLAKLNGTFTSEIRNEDLWQLMRNPSNIHYHVCYNSSSKYIDEYYEILKANYPQSVWLHPSMRIQDIDRHECDYIWIIHGDENNYAEFIKDLQINYKSEGNIFSYNWLADLLEGSNRIEYLMNNKIKYFTRSQVEEVKTQTGKNEETVVMIEMSSKKKSKKNDKKLKIICGVADCQRQFKNSNALKDHQTSKHSTVQTITIPDREISPPIADNSEAFSKRQKIKCSIDGCEKKYRSENALKQHELAAHASVQTPTHDSTTTTATTTFTIHNSKKIKKKEKKKCICGIDNCQTSRKNHPALLQHQIETHSLPLRCLLSEECFALNEKYCGFRALQNHLIFQHAASFPRSICPISECKSSETWPDCLHLLNHILQKHTEYLLDDHKLNTDVQISTSSNMIKVAIPCWELSDP